MRRITVRTPFFLVTLLVTIAAGCFGSSTKPVHGTAGDASAPDTATVSPVADATPDAKHVTDAADGAAPPPPAAGGTGAFGIVTVNGRQKMYLPQTTAGADGNAVIVVVDVGLVGNGVNGAPAQVATIDLGSPNYATATGGDSTVVVAVSTQYNTVYFIDPATDTLTGSLTLDDTYGQSSFSGGGGFVTGVAIDSANDRAILSVWNGFAIVSLKTRTITSVIQAPPTENFGFDSAHQRLISPFYDCTGSLVTVDGSSVMPSSCNTPVAPDGTVISDGLSIVDLTDGTVYTYEQSNQPDGGFNGQILDPTAPVGFSPDSAAADPTTGVIVVPSEGGGFQNVIDLSRATFDKTMRTVTAPQNVIPNLNLDGVAVEASAHLAFWEQEFDSFVAVADLTQANAGGTASVTGTMPAVPGGTVFLNLGDPHGIAVTTSIAGGGPVGFVVDSGFQWVARVDLAAMVKNAQPDASATLTDVQMAPYVTFLDALTPLAGAAGDGGASDGGGE
jgi:hypothetical protein